MKDIKLPQKIKFFVNVSYSVKENTIFQVFSFNTTNKKYLKYVYDQRFNLKNKIEKIIKKEMLNSSSFLSRIENETNITMTYKNDFDVDKTSRIINCEFYLPPYKGCKYCVFCNNSEDFLFCSKKEKHYNSPGIKTCAVFQSKDEVLS